MAGPNQRWAGAVSPNTARRRRLTRFMPGGPAQGVRPPSLREVGLRLLPDLEVLRAFLVGQRCHELQALERRRVAEHDAVEGVGGKLVVGRGVGRGGGADL